MALTRGVGTRGHLVEHGVCELQSEGQAGVVGWRSLGRWIADRQSRAHWQLADPGRERGTESVWRTHRRIFADDVRRHARAHYGEFVQWERPSVFARITHTHAASARPT